VSHRIDDAMRAPRAAAALRIDARATKLVAPGLLGRAPHP